VNALQILIIEDDVALGETVAEMLALLGFTAELVSDGIQSTQRLTEVAPQLVLLDVHMPGCNGVDILARIRADKRLRAIKVVMTTADKYLDLAHLSQADAVLYKPYTIQAFEVAINQVMNAAAHSSLPLIPLPTGY
jgi:CheY-like chemotaxis protein